jgi:hypothetical protein
LRCGSDDAQSPGRCCFHPGLVPVPGPLMYSPEWHACRAACTPDAPGCYSRREHYYLPSLNASRPTAGAAAAGARSRLGGQQLSGPPRKMQAAAAQQQGLGRGSSGQGSSVSSSSSSRIKMGASGRAIAEQQQHAAGELQPRSVLPRPITPKSALRASQRVL